MIYYIMNNTELILYEQINNGITIFKKFDYLKLACDIFFCLVNIYKLFFS